MLKIDIDDSKRIVYLLWRQQDIKREYEHQPEKRNARSAGVVPGGTGRYGLELQGNLYWSRYGFPPEGQKEPRLPVTERQDL